MVRISTKISLVVLVCVLFVATIIATLAIARSGGLLEAKAREGLLTVTQAVANDIEVRNQEMQSSVETLGAVMKSTFDYDAYAKTGDVTPHATLLGRAIRDTVARIGRDRAGIYAEYDVDHFSYTYSPWFILRDGVPTQEITEEGSYSFDPADPDMVWYFAPIEAKHGVWTGVYEDTDIGVMMYSYVSPVFTEDEKLIGIIGMDVDLQEIQETVRAVEVYGTGYSFLLDETGGAIVAPKEGLDAALLADLAGRQGEGVLTADDKLASYVRLSNGQLLVTVADRAAVLAPIAALRTQLLAISLLAAVIVCGIGYFIVAGVTRRIKDVTVAAQRITDGDFDVALPKGAKDEIGELSAAMEMLVAAFKQRKK